MDGGAKSFSESNSIAVVSKNNVEITSKTASTQLFTSRKWSDQLCVKN